MSSSRQWNNILNGSGRAPLAPRQAKAAAVALVRAAAGDAEKPEPPPAPARPAAVLEREAFGLEDDDVAAAVRERESREGSRKREADKAGSGDDDDDDDNVDDDADNGEAPQPAEVLADGVIGVGRFRKKKTAREKRKPKRKTSVMHVLFETGEVADTYLCRMTPYTSKPGHKEEVKAGSGTSNLIHHAKKWHTELYDALVKAYNDNDDVEQVFQSFIAGLSAPVTPLERAGVSVTKVSELGLSRQIALLVCVIANCLPFAVVDSEHFVTWMKLCGVMYPSRRTLMKLLPVLYDHALTSLVADLKLAGSMSLTFDAWQSLRGTKYLVVTAHAITPSWTMISAPLDLIAMHYRAYGELIALTIESRIKDHGLDGVLLATTTSDNGSNCRLAKSILTPGDEEPCFNHCMHLMVNDVLDGSDTQPPLDAYAGKDFTALATAISFIRGSSVLRSALKGLCKEKQVPDLELIMENVTRWEGRHDAAARVIQLEGPLTVMRERGLLNVLVENVAAAVSADVFQPDFFVRLKAYLPILQQLVIISKAAQSQSGPTLSCVPHFVFTLRLACSERPNDGRVTERFKLAFRRAIDSRLAVFVQVEVDGGERIVANAVKAAMLDPRHSAEMHDKLSEDERVAVRDAIIADVLHVLPAERADTYEKMLELTWESVLAELRKAPPALDGLGALLWWRTFVAKDVGGLHVNWARAARLLLAIPAGSSPSESAFSSTGETVTKKRTRLGDDTLEMMTITRHYVRRPDFDLATMVAEVRARAKAALASEDEDDGPPSDGEAPEGQEG
jgi:hypothetical protein